MKVLLCSVFAVLSFASASQAQESTFTDFSKVPATIQTLDVHVFDLKQVGGACDDVTCFRMDVYINGEWVARWITSPGTTGHKDYAGGYTPEWENKSFNTGRIYNAYKNKHGDSMPYAMFLGSTGYAVHASGVVNGRRASHGCIRLRLEDAKQLNQWMRQAVANGDVPALRTEHTDPRN